MDKLKIEPTTFTPEVTFDVEKRVFEISGESRPQDSREFYAQIITWLNELDAHLKPSGKEQNEYVFNLNFNYFNSSSGKFILDICKIIARIRAREINASVRWYHERDDNDMLEAGMEISQMVRFPFEYVETEPKDYFPNGNGLDQSE